MEGVTTAIVAFILACLIFPKVIKNKPQYYGAVACVLLIILFGALAAMIPVLGFVRFAAVMIGLLQAGALLLLILSAGGLSMRDFAGELAETIEVVRRGGEKEIIIPRKGETPRPRGSAGGKPKGEKRAARIKFDAGFRAPPPPPPSAPPPPGPPRARPPGHHPGLSPAPSP